MIGIAPAHENQMINYTSWLNKRGLTYKILNENDSLDDVTLLLLCGGPDIGLLPNRDKIETKWFNEAYGKIHVIGICRGLQLANVVLGGTLHEDLSNEKIRHTSNKVQIADEPQPTLESSWHDVFLINEQKSITVNSRHHQGIDILAHGLSVVAMCDDDLIEMVEGDKSLFVQWHPERPEVWNTDAELIVFKWIEKIYNLNSL